MGEKTIPEHIAELALKRFKKGDTVFIYANTVSDVADIYKEIFKHTDKVINGDQLAIYHSGYVPRRKKEMLNELTKKYGKDSGSEFSGIVVMSQIGEMSLDISCDYMITMICPGDALIQRVGRLKRWEDSFEADVDVIQPSEYGMIYDHRLLNNAINHLKKHPTVNLPEDTRDLVETSYIGMTLAEEIKRKEQERQLLPHPDEDNRLMYNKFVARNEFSTRDDSYPQIEVFMIPEEKFQEVLSWPRQSIREEYMLKFPVYIFEGYIYKWYEKELDYTPCLKCISTEAGLVATIPGYRLSYDELGIGRSIEKLP